VFTFVFFGGLVSSLESCLCDAGGLSENDFILAAKIDQIDTRDLVSRKNKFWA
jgi:hypothetical protein